MELLRRIQGAIDRLSGWIGAGVSWLVLVMVLLGAFNAVARYLGRYVGVNLSSNAWIEGQWYLFSLVFLLGAAYTLQQDRHVRVDVLYGRLSKKQKAWIDLVGTMVFLLPFCVFALVFSWPAVSNSWAILEMSSDSGGLPRYPIKTALLVGFVLLALQGLSELIKRVRVVAGDEEAA
jgi:TRAP-type mannitol/chloroaromatic compound transport system permease small subunit